MQTHTMTFKSFQDKRVAVDWIRENIEPDTFEECLTEKRIVFFTGIELQSRKILLIQRTCSPHTYKVTNY
jgi:hypothetical protein